MSGKRILAVYFSLTQQTRKVIGALEEALVAGGHEVDHLELELADDKYKLPHSFPNFWKDWALTTAGKQIKVNLVPKTAPRPVEDYDLVILGYQPWFMKPSFPVRTWLTSAAGSILEGKKVVSVITARGAWKACFAEANRLVKAQGGEIVDSLALCAQVGDPMNFMQLSRWLFRNDDPDQSYQRKYGPYGVGDVGIAAANAFGASLSMRLTAESMPVTASHTEVNVSGAAYSA